MRKVRIVCYDSVEIEAKRNDSARGKNGQTPAAHFVKGLQAQAIEDFGDEPDQLYFKPGSLLTLETGVRFSNLKPVKPQNEEELNENNESCSNEDS